jgi:hypothetical protein
VDCEEDCKEEEGEAEEEEDDCMAEERDPIYEPSVARQHHLARQAQRRRQHMVLPPSRQCRELRQPLRDLQDFLASPLVLHRQGAAVQPATLRSTLLLIRQYLWFCWQKRHIFKPTLVAFEDLERYVAYLRWLLGERQLQPVSVLNHMSAAAASVHKFLQRYEAFPNRNYEDVAAICFLRQLRRQIQCMVQRFRPPTSEELNQMQRWFPWEQVVQVCERLKQRYEAGERGSEQRTSALMEFLVVAMYVYFPPVRASPIRQLEQGESLVWDAERRKWFLDLRKVCALCFCVFALCCSLWVFLCTGVVLSIFSLSCVCKYSNCLSLDALVVVYSCHLCYCVRWGLSLSLPIVSFIGCLFVS